MTRKPGPLVQPQAGRVLRNTPDWIVQIPASSDDAISALSSAYKRRLTLRTRSTEMHRGIGVGAAVTGMLD